MRYELIHDVLAHGTEFNVSSAWTLTDCVASADQVVAVDGRQVGDRMIFSGSAPTLEQEVSVVGTIADLNVELGVWAKVLPSVASAGGFLTIFDPSTAQVSSVALTLVESLTLQRLQHVFSDNLTDTSFFVQIGGPTAASGDSFDLARAHCAVGSGNLTILPEPNFQRRDTKLQDEHRGRTGKRFVYKWGEYYLTRFGVKFVNSMDTSIINSWWSSNTKLLWIVGTGAQVESVQLLGDDLPLGEYAVPALDQYEGTIELGTY